MGGIDAPYQFMMRALDAGKVVVTGNKALLAERGFEIFEKAAEKGVPIFFEAAVAGGIPIIKSIREGFHRKSHRIHPRYSERYEQLHFVQDDRGKHGFS